MEVICNDSRKCFAKAEKTPTKSLCMILNASDYENGRCPFCKRYPDMTNGTRYPYNPLYGKLMA